MPRKRNPPSSPAVYPYRVVIDTREQLPYSFDGLRTDAKYGSRPFAVEVVRAKLDAGDYSLEGFEGVLAIERKSPEDLYHTIGQDRDRFERELMRLNQYQSARVVVEAEWTELINYPPVHSKLSPKAVVRSIFCWQERFTRVHWVMLPSREIAQYCTFRIMERFLKERGLICFSKSSSLPACSLASPTPTTNNASDATPSCAV